MAFLCNHCLHLVLKCSPQSKVKPLPIKPHSPMAPTLSPRHPPIPWSFLVLFGGLHLCSKFLSAVLTTNTLAGSSISQTETSRHFLGWISKAAAEKQNFIWDNVCAYTVQSVLGCYCLNRFSSEGHIKDKFSSHIDLRTALTSAFFIT